MEDEIFKKGTSIILFDTTIIDIPKRMKVFLTTTHSKHSFHLFLHSS